MAVGGVGPVDRVLAVGALVVVALFVVAVAAGYSSTRLAVGTGHGLLVVVTFPGLVEDVEKITCSGDRVVSLVPPGVDPHNYYLTPRGVELLRRADVVVSLGHTPLEYAVHRLHALHVFSGVLVEVPRIPGVRLLPNPVTGQPDLHMPLYDPRNYAVFVEYLARVLAGLRPECRSIYLQSASEEALTALRLLRTAPRLGVTAVADSPPIVYAVDWLGVRVVALLNPGYGLPATPATVDEVESAVTGHRVGLVVVTYPAESKVSRWLLGLAADNGVPVLYVYSPLYPLPVIEKIRRVSSVAAMLRGGGG